MVRRGDHSVQHDAHHQRQCKEGQAEGEAERRECRGAGQKGCTVGNK